MVELDWVPELEGQVMVLDLVPGLEVVVLDPVLLDLHFVLPLALVLLEELMVWLVCRGFVHCRWSFICHSPLSMCNDFIPVTLITICFEKLFFSFC